MSKLSQKEYLKKYLSGQKKKRKVPKGTKVKLIDDDFNATDTLKRADDDLILCGEDAPQIVEIIDDRSLRMKTIDDFRKSGKWKSVSNIDETIDEGAKVNKQTNINSHLHNFEEKSYKSSKLNETPDRDLSPVRKRNEHIKQSPDSDLSPQRIKQERRSHSPDIHTSTKRKENERKNKSSDSDLSPQRKRTKHRNCSPGGDLSPQRRTKDRRYRTPGSDLFPQRIKKEPRHQNSDNDSSTKTKERVHKDKSPDSDLSPQRKRKERRNCSPDRDLSPKRKRTNKDVLPAQKDRSTKFKGQNAYSSDPDLYSHIKHKQRHRSFSPNLNSKQYPHGSSQKDDKREHRKETSSRSEKTLDGKSAGLQNAAMLKKELEQSRKREDELFEKLSKDVTGKHSEVVVREKKHKGSTDYDEEREERKRIEKEARRKTYSRWGKGVKQAEEYENKLTEDLYESSKPLARYSNDADLDKYLKDQERDGDPMLEYMRSKKREQDSNKPAVPVYKGSYPENRFNIKPGYRWDGVDRSNGYEAKWFTIQNEKKARQEEAYRYSTEDM